jgi:hypothetical protein
MIRELHLTAVNSDPESENRMHADDVAQSLGFRAGLVPGVDVFEYMARLLIDTEPVWFADGGSAELRLLKPYYDGEAVRVTLDPREKRVQADDRATLQYGIEILETAAVPPFALLPLAPARPKAHEALLEPGTTLGSFRRILQAGVPASQTAREFLELANRLLMYNFILDPWIHAGSRIHWLANAMHNIREVEVRGEILERKERKGHGFVTFRVVYLDVDQAMSPVAWIDHTAIWKFGGLGT